MKRISAQAFVKLVEQSKLCGVPHTKADFKEFAATHGFSVPVAFFNDHKHSRGKWIVECSTDKNPDIDDNDFVVDVVNETAILKVVKVIDTVTGSELLTTTSPDTPDIDIIHKFKRSLRDT